MNKFIYAGLLPFFLTACASQDVEKEEETIALEQSFEQDLYLDLFDEEEDEVDYEAYFFDSKGERFLEKNSCFN